MYKLKFVSVKVNEKKYIFTVHSLLNANLRKLLLGTATVRPHRMLPLVSEVGVSKSAVGFHGVRCRDVQVLLLSPEQTAEVLDWLYFISFSRCRHWPLAVLKRTWSVHVRTGCHHNSHSAGGHLDWWTIQSRTKQQSRKHRAPRSLGVLPLQFRLCSWSPSSLMIDKTTALAHGPDIQLIVALYKHKQQAACIRQQLPQTNKPTWLGCSEDQLRWPCINTNGQCM